MVAMGRLDINTEGLLLLTNDGGLARVIAHPATGWLRRYSVRAHGKINQAELDRPAGRHRRRRHGLRRRSRRALDREQGDNAWITIGLREGKNREVKRILEHARPAGEPADPHLLRSVPARRPRGRARRGGAHAGAAGPARRGAGDEAGVDFESPVREPIAPFGSPTKNDRHDRGERRRAPVPRRPRPRPGAPAPPSRRRRAAVPRDRDGERRGRDRGGAAEAPLPPDPKRSVWRAGETDEDAPRKKMPRRGADPREARAAAGERQRERVGAIASAEGRKVVVERLVRQPQEEEAPAPSRGRGAARGEDRPRRRDDRDAPPRRDRDAGARPRRDDDRPRRPAGDRPFRARSEGAEDRPRARQGERPFRSREGGDDRPRKPQGERPFRARGDDDRPRRGPPRGDGPSRSGPRGGAGGGFKSGPRGASKGGASKGGFKGGGSKGGPRGRR